MTLRPDLNAIAEFIKPDTTILDLGCGNGELLAYLIEHKGIQGRGIERSESDLLECVRRGISVRQGNLEEGLADYPDNSVDMVILSQTLPFLNHPAMILQEMLRVGQRAIVSFPNWGHWRCRLHFLLTGQIPSVPDIPQSWHDPPRWQAFTITDFAHFCQELEVTIQAQVYLSGQQKIAPGSAKNLLATTAVFLLQK
ncbi:MAG: methionine biosynthesis protein MetW [Chloroflexota bacterium]